MTYSETTRQNGYLATVAGYVAYTWNLYNNNATIQDIVNAGYPISSSIIKSGDVLVSVIDNNAVIFGSWANTVKTQYWGY